MPLPIIEWISVHCLFHETSNSLHNSSQCQKFIPLNVPSSLSLNNIKVAVSKNYLFNSYDFRVLRTHSSKLPDCNNWLILISWSILQMLINSGRLFSGIPNIGSDTAQLFTDVTITRSLGHPTKDCPNNARCVGSGLGIRTRIVPKLLRIPTVLFIARYIRLFSTLYINSWIQNTCSFFLLFLASSIFL